MQSDMLCSALCIQMLRDVVGCCAARIVPCLSGSRSRGLGVAVSITMVASAYKHVAWHTGIKKYIVQVTHRGTRRHRAFTEESDAVSYLVKLTRKPESQLRREFYRKQLEAKHHWSAYKHIAWHRGIQLWIVQHQGKTWGTFKSHAKALTHICQRLGVEKSALKKPSKFPKAYSLERFRILIPIFQHGLQGDLASARAHTTHSRYMFVALPVLEFVSIMSKYGPYKDLLLQAWESRGQGVQQQQGHQSLRHALAIIKQACKEYAKLSSDIINPWIEHCGRNVSHHMGPLPLCRRLGVVVSCSASHPQAMYMGKNAKPVRLASTFQENSRAIFKLQRVSNFMKQVADVRSRSRGVVKSCADWVSFTTGILDAMRTTKPPGLTSGTYTQLWFARSLLIASGPEDLQVKGVSVKEFSEVFPDAKNWLALFPQGSISAAMSKCGYSASPALFTMHLCLLGSKDMNYDLAWLRRHAKDIAEKRERLASEIHMSPIPSSCCLAVLNEH